MNCLKCSQPYFTQAWCTLKCLLNIQKNNLTNKRLQIDLLDRPDGSAYYNLVLLHKIGLANFHIFTWQWIGIYIFSSESNDHERNRMVPIYKNFVTDLLFVMPHCHYKSSENIKGSYFPTNVDTCLFLFFFNLQIMAYVAIKSRKCP